MQTGWWRNGKMLGTGGLLTRLGRDVRANTLAIMAAAMIPVIGFAGSAIDLARLYVVRVRLQQACDAGVLAGRKAMTDYSISTALDSTAANQANTFFANNFFAKYDATAGTFTGNWYKTSGITFTPVKATNGTTTVANAVTGTAKVTVPMALMQYFGFASTQVAVTCQAVYDLADTDVMFVLDTTGSMSCYPSDPSNCATSPISSYKRTDGSTGYANPEKSPTTSGGVTTYSKIESLRQAVMLFDTTMRTNVDSTTHFRYGFVPYSSAVNVGAAFQNGLSQYLQNTTWTYQSRHLSPLTGNGGMIAGDYAYGSPTDFSQTGIPKAYCVEQRYPATGFATSGISWNTSYAQAEHYYNLSWSSAAGGTCSGKQQPLRPYWRYEPVSYDISQYVAGNAVANPTRFDGSTIKWRGCVEELNTTTGSSFDVGNLPDDLNPDIKPSGGTYGWRPMAPDVEWLRAFGSTSQDFRDDQVNEDFSSNIYGYAYAGYGLDFSYAGTHVADQNGYAACGMPAQRLGVMTAQQVHDYVYANDFRPFGGTYHDVGMIWGTRMLSPDGVFGSDTAPWPGRKAPSRNIVFMTDGTMSPNSVGYGQYGVEALDARSGAGSDQSTDSSGHTVDYNNHTARFRVECDAAKKKGITIYVVAVGTAVTDDLTYCASPGQTFPANSTADLTAAFKAIAQRVAMLRIAQ